LLKHRPALGNIEVNYLRLTFAPHLAQMIGLSHPAQALEEAPVSLELVGSRVITTNAVTEDLPHLGQTIHHHLDTTHTPGQVYEAPHPLNCDLGITDMHVYIPDTIERMSVGKSTAPLLDTIPISHTPNARVRYNVINPQKRKLLREELHEMAVQVLDFEGKRIQFAPSINGLRIEARLKKVVPGTL
jgi:hypothetical protein